MAVLQISYSDLNSTSNYALQASKKLDGYATKLSDKVTKKINSIYGGESDRTNFARRETNEKITNLRQKATKMSNYSRKINNFTNEVKEKDKAVASRITELRNEFAKQNDIKISKVQEFFQWLVVDNLNKSAFGKWVKESFDDRKDFLLGLKDSINNWYRTGGGKYVVDVIWSVVAVAGAIFAVFTAGAVLALICSITLLVVSVADLYFNIQNNREACTINDSDPFRAYKVGKTDKLSDTLNLNGHEKLAAVVVAIESVAGIGTLVSSLWSSGKLLLKKSKAIENLFFNNKSPLGKKIYLNVRGKNKFSLSNGLKSIIGDKGFRNKLLNNFKKEFGKDLRKFNRYIKNKNNTLKQIGISGFTKRLIKAEIKEFISPFSKIKKFDGTPKLFKLKMFKEGKLPAPLLNSLKGLNYVKASKDKVNTVYTDGKFNVNIGIKIKFKSSDSFNKIFKHIGTINDQMEILIN